MRGKCIDNLDIEKYVTIGKIYVMEGTDSTSIKNIDCDDEQNRCLLASRFVILTDREELIEEAKERFPIGSTIIGRYGIKYKVTTTPVFGFADDGDMHIGVNNIHGSGVTVWKNGDWGRVIEFVLPLTWYVTVTEENKEILRQWRGDSVTALPIGFIVGMYKYEFGEVAKAHNRVVESNWVGSKEITFEEFKKYVLKEVEKGYLITRTQFKELYNVSCGEWKVKITELINDTIGPFENDGVLSSNQVREMFDAISNDLQRNALSKVFPGFINIETLEDLKGNGDYFNDSRVFLPSYSPLISIRNGGEYEYRAFALNNNFNWKMINDTSGCQILIPTGCQILIPSRK